MPQRSTFTGTAEAQHRFKSEASAWLLSPLPCMVIMPSPSMLTLNRGKNHMEILSSSDKRNWHIHKLIHACTFLSLFVSLLSEILWNDSLTPTLLYMSGQRSNFGTYRLSHTSACTESMTPCCCCNLKLLDKTFPIPSYLPLFEPMSSDGKWVRDLYLAWDSWKIFNL
jgi:hypothetical protein